MTVAFLTCSHRLDQNIITNVCWKIMQKDEKRNIRSMAKIKIRLAIRYIALSFLIQHIARCNFFCLLDSFGSYDRSIYRLEDSTNTVNIQEAELAAIESFGLSVHWESSKSGSSCLSMWYLIRGWMLNTLNCARRQRILNTLIRN